MSAFTRKYATATHIYIPIVKRAVVDFAVGADWTPVAGDVKVSIDGGAVSNIATLPVAIASGNGAFWDFALSSGETTGKKITIVVVDAATKAVEDQAFVIETYGHASAEYQADLSLPNLPANVTQILGTAVSTPATAGILDVNVKNIDNDAASASGTVTFPNATLASTTNITAGTITTVTTVTNQLTAAAIATGVWTDTVAGDFTTALSVGKSVMNGVTLGTGLTVARCTLTDTLTTYTGNTVQTGDSFARIGATGSGLTSLLASSNFIAATGTASAGASTTITLAGASATDSAYNGETVLITGGTGAGQSRVISGYVGATKVATVSPAWATNPDNTSTFSVIATGRSVVDQWLGVAPLALSSQQVQSVVPAATIVASVTGNVGGSVASVVGLTASNLDTTISSRMATYTQPTGFLAATFPTTVASTTNITAGTITTVTTTTTATNVTTVNGLAAGVITAASIAADAITAAKIADGAIDAATFAAGAIDASAIATDAFGALELAAGAASEIATAVRTELTTELGRIDVTVSSRLASASYTAPSNLTAAQIATGVWTDTTAGDFTTALSIGKSVMNGVSLGTGLTVAAVTGLTASNLDATISSRATPAQVNTECDTALSDVGLTSTVTGRIDVAISTRGTGTGTALDAAGVRSAVGLATANLDTQLDALPTNAELSTALGTADDATLAAIAALNNLSIANVRTAVGLASANLDTQLGTINTAVVTTIPGTITTLQGDTDDIQSRLPAALTANGNIKADTLRVAGTVQTAGDIVALVNTVDARLDTEIPAIKAKTDQLMFTIANQVDSNSLSGGGLDAAETRVAIGLAAANMDTQFSTALKLLRADHYIDTGVTPWALVFMEEGTGGIGVGVELYRKRLYSTAGATLTSVDTVVGQAKQ